MPPFFIGKTAGKNLEWNVEKCIQMDKTVDFDKKILIFCVLCFEMQWKFMDISFKMACVLERYSVVSLIKKYKERKELVQFFWPLMLKHIFFLGDMSEKNTCFFMEEM